MSVLLRNRLMTAEEFQPIEEGRYDLIEGRLVPMPRLPVQNMVM